MSRSSQTRKHCICHSYPPDLMTSQDAETRLLAVFQRPSPQTNRRSRVVEKSRKQIRMTNFFRSKAHDLNKNGHTGSQETNKIYIIHPWARICHPASLFWRHVLGACANKVAMKATLQDPVLWGSLITNGPAIVKQLICPQGQSISAGCRNAAP